MSGGAGLTQFDDFSGREMLDAFQVVVDLRAEGDVACLASMMRRIFIA